MFSISVISCTGKVEKAEELPVESVLNVSDAQKKEFRYANSTNLLPKSVVKMKHYKRFDIGNLLQRLFCGTDLRLYLSYGDNGARGGADIGGDKKSCP